MIKTVSTLKPQHLNPKLSPELPPLPPQLPLSGFVRVWQIVGDKKRNIPPLIPISRSSFLNGVRSGKYPKPIKLGEKTTAWRVDDIKNLIDSMGA